RTIRGNATMVCTHGAINLRDGKTLEALLGQEFGLSRIRSSKALHQQAREGLGWCSAGRGRTGVLFLLATENASGHRIMAGARMGFASRLLKRPTKLPCPGNSTHASLLLVAAFHFSERPPF